MSLCSLFIFYMICRFDMRLVIVRVGIVLNSLFARQLSFFPSIICRMKNEEGDRQSLAQCESLQHLCHDLHERSHHSHCKDTPNFHWLWWYSLFSHFPTETFLYSFYNPMCTKWITTKSCNWEFLSWGALMFSNFFLILTTCSVISNPISFDANLLNIEVGTPCLFGEINTEIISFTAYLPKFINS